MRAIRGCEEGEPYRFIAINTSMSECCWYAGCPEDFLPAVEEIWLDGIEVTTYASCPAS
jgi:hypothetical protein